MPTETYYPVNGRITLYSYNHHSEPVRITATALTDIKEGSVQISNWKINDARTEVTLTIVHVGSYAEFVEETFPCEVKETPLPKPGRNWEWSEFNGCWRHKKTGIRVKNV
jgi:hypothetical protein